MDIHQMLPGLGYWSARGLDLRAVGIWNRRASALSCLACPTLGTFGQSCSHHAHVPWVTWQLKMEVNTIPKDFTYTTTKHINLYAYNIWQSCTYVASLWNMHSPTHLPSELQRPEGKWCQIKKFAKRMSPWWLLNVFKKLAIRTSLVALPILTIFLRQRDLGENPCNEALDACEWSSWMYTTSFLVLCASTASTFNRIVEYHWDFWVCHLSRYSQGDHWSGAFYVCRGGHGDHHKIWTFWRWRSCTKTLWIVILLNVHTFSVHDLWQLGILCKASRKKTTGFLK